MFAIYARQSVYREDSSEPLNERYARQSGRSTASLILRTSRRQKPS